MILNTKPFCLIVAILALTASVPAQTFKVLKSFNPNTPATSHYPEAALVQGPNNTFYGTTSDGGSGAQGVVFAVQSNGTGFTVLKNFLGVDGRNPQAELVLSGSTLYGTTYYGGNRATYGGGTVFCVNTDGNGFSNLYSFGDTFFDSNTGNYTNYDGNGLAAGLVLSGETLYGAASQGGAFGQGTVFSVNTNGGGFSNLHSFGSGTDGAAPKGSLVLLGGVLYGTTSAGGISNAGTIFRINTDGSGYSNLHSFSGIEGSVPSAGLVIVGNTLYGTANRGGSFWGTVFRINTDGNGFTNLHSFNSSDGSFPSASLVLSGTTLYGTTTSGGNSGQGTVFRINTDGSNFAKLYSFTTRTSTLYTNLDGANPYAGLILLGNTLFGTALYGGTSGVGTIFKVNTDGSNYVVLKHFAGVTEGTEPYAGLVLSGNAIFGTTSAGGASDAGTVYKVNTDGSGFTNLHAFRGSPDDGYSPYAELVMSSDTLYGTTYVGGSFNGTVFGMGIDGSRFTNIYFFTGGNDGADVAAGLVLSGDTLYGTTEDGGIYGKGAVFRVSTNGSSFTNIHSFNTSDGANPRAGLVLASNSLYGTTSSGGNSGSGNIFKINTDGGGFTVLRNFSAVSDGSAPQAGLVLSGSTLYGTTASGGGSSLGTIFRIDTNGNNFTNLHNFGPGTDGGHPQAKLTLFASTLYGTTVNGGTSNAGTVFKINTDATGYAILHNFSGGTNGAFPQGHLVLSAGTLYGTTANGGSANAGTVFSLSLIPQITLAPVGQNIIVSWPTNTLGLILESTTNLVPPVVWAPVSPGPTVINGQNTVTNLVGVMRFYRLTFP